MCYHCPLHCPKGCQYFTKPNYHPKHCFKQCQLPEKFKRKSQKPHPKIDVIRHNFNVVNRKTKQTSLLCEICSKVLYTEFYTHKLVKSYHCASCHPLFSSQNYILILHYSIEDDNTFSYIVRQNDGTFAFKNYKT